MLVHFWVIKCIEKWSSHNTTTRWVRWTVFIESMKIQLHRSEQSSFYRKHFSVEIGHKWMETSIVFITTICSIKFLFILKKERDSLRIFGEFYEKIISNSQKKVIFKKESKRMDFRNITKDWTEMVPYLHFMISNYAVNHTRFGVSQKILY